MRFRTEIEIPDLKGRIKPGDRIFSIGSCFAENIAGRFRDGGFAVVSNPFGVLYNPASIAMALEHIHAGKQFCRQDLVQSGELWCSPFFHGSFSCNSAERSLEKMNRAAGEAQQALVRADHVIVSFGTPWVYTVSEKFSSLYPSLPEGTVVANCHKFPADHYRRRRMTIDEIAGIFTALADGPLNGKNVIFTVSPVRYIKDGLHGSNLGKAVLLLAVEKICESGGRAEYFPAYEALMDDLRDYRFYDSDMTHPSRQAVDYIWELFRSHAMTPDAAAQAEEIGKLTGATGHRVVNPGGAEHLRWIDSMLGKIAGLRKKYPSADLSQPLTFFRGERDRHGVGDNGITE